MRTGELRDRITLERLQGGDAEHPDGLWQPLADTPDVWAAIEWQGDGRARIRIRYRADLHTLADIEPAMRAIYVAPSGRVHALDIEDVAEVVRRQEVHLAVKEVIVDMPAVSTGGNRVKSWR